MENISITSFSDLNLHAPCHDAIKEIIGAKCSLLVLNSNIIMQNWFAYSTFSLITWERKWKWRRWRWMRRWRKLFESKQVNNQLCFSVSRGLHSRKTQECHGSALGGWRVYKKWLKTRSRPDHTRALVVTVIIIQVRCSIAIVCFMLWHNLNSASVTLWAKLARHWDCGHITLDKVRRELIYSIILYCGHITLDTGQRVCFIFRYPHELTISKSTFIAGRLLVSALIKLQL